MLNYCLDSTRTKSLDKKCIYLSDFHCTFPKMKCADSLQCVHINSICDGRPGDCHDGSDEENCKGMVTKVHTGKFCSDYF